MAKTPKEQIAGRVAEAARILQIEALLDRKPRQLSGGQRQRVAIGRAIVRHPKLFLFDEPLSNLDAELRTQMRVEIAKLHRDLGATMVYVTHDQVEAMTLADRIVVLRGGRVEQIGTPTELYDTPANAFVAGFIGSPKMNFLTADFAGMEGHNARLAHPAFASDIRIPLTTQRAPSPGSRVTLGLRPEHLVLGGEDRLFDLTVDFSENLGGATQIYAAAPGTQGGPGTQTVTILAPGRPGVARGDRVPVSLGAGRIYLFDESGAAL